AADWRAADPGADGGQDDQPVRAADQGRDLRGEHDPCPGKTSGYLVWDTLPHPQREWEADSSLCGDRPGEPDFVPAGVCGFWRLLSGVGAVFPADPGTGERLSAVPPGTG